MPIKSNIYLRSRFFDPVSIELGIIPIESTSGDAVYNGVLKRWNGSIWMNSPLKVFVATQFVSKPLKLWNGSEWVNVNITGI